MDSVIFNRLDSILAEAADNEINLSSEQARLHLIKQISYLLSEFNNNFEIREEE